MILPTFTKQESHCVTSNFSKNSLGVASDLECIRWYTKASERKWKGQSVAQHNLAVIYENGRGTIGDIHLPDYFKAFSLYKDAAENGLIFSWVKVSEMYKKGQGVSQNYVEAYKWAYIASTKGIPTSLRDDIGKLMTPEQIEEATLMAENWLRKNGDKGSEWKTTITIDEKKGTP